MNKELLEAQIKNIMLAHGTTRLKVEVEIGDDYWNYENGHCRHSGTYLQDTQPMEIYRTPIESMAMYSNGQITRRVVRANRND